MIELLSDFDGASPHSQEGISKINDNEFILYPSWRSEPGISEEAKGSGSRLYSRINNSGTKTENINIIVDWELPDRCLHHDFAYFKQADGQWEMIPNQKISDSSFLHELTVKPGINELSLAPTYNYQTMCLFVSSLNKKGVKSSVIGKSQEQRNLYLLNFPSSDKDAPVFFVQSRDHAYETAGSYCIEGIVEFLTSKIPLNNYLRSKFNFYIVPMTNVDGVYNGMSRLTAPKGADMNRVHTAPDAAHSTLRKCIDSLCPKVHMNIHNWTGKFDDGLLANDQCMANSISQFMPADVDNFKQWYIQTSEDYYNELKKRGEYDKETVRQCQSWKNYCQDNFGAFGVNFEFPWFNLNIEKMKKKGAKALQSYALSVIKELKI